MLKIFRGSVDHAPLKFAEADVATLVTKTKANSLSGPHKEEMLKGFAICHCCLRTVLESAVFNKIELFPVLRIRGIFNFADQPSMPCIQASRSILTKFWRTFIKVQSVLMLLFSDTSTRWASSRSNDPWPRLTTKSFDSASRGHRPNCWNFYIWWVFFIYDERWLLVKKPHSVSD